MVSWCANCFWLDKVNNLVYTFPLLSSHSPLCQWCIILFFFNRTRDTLASGQFLSVMNILMQLRKVCNHPNLFEPRPITSPFFQGSEEVRCEVPRLVANASYPFLVPLPPSCGRFPGPAVLTPSACTTPDLDWLDRAGAAARLLGQSKNLAEMARDLPGFVAKRVFELRARPNLISVMEASDTSDSSNNAYLLHVSS